MQEFIAIAIDGPSGAGKSTMAKKIAREMNFIYLDTGAMYRSFALYTLEQGISYEGELANEAIVALLPNFHLDIRYGEEGQQMFVNGADVTGRIRTPEVSMAASRVATIPAVRLQLVEIQREFARHANVVMDGRDIGSYVLPQAQVKIFLTASLEDRAQRRFAELRAKGDTRVSYEEVLQDMKVRDANDSGRAFAPLVQAADAVCLDTSGLSVEESVEKIREVVRNAV